MKHSPTLIAFMFIVITLARVGTFAETRMRAGWLGWVFSFTLGVCVYTAAYYTREHIIKEGGDRRSITVQRWAWFVLIMSALVDGLFNLSEVWLAVSPADPLMQIATGAYGIFPTLAAGLLGALQGHVDRLPRPPVAQGTNITLSVRRWFVSQLDASTNSTQLSKRDESPVVLLSNPSTNSTNDPLPFKCKHRGCDAAFDNRFSLSSHARKHKSVSVETGK
jgi:hypothetical protein